MPVTGRSDRGEFQPVSMGIRFPEPVRKTESPRPVKPAGPRSSVSRVAPAGRRVPSVHRSSDRSQASRYRKSSANRRAASIRGNAAVRGTSGCSGTSLSGTKALPVLAAALAMMVMIGSGMLDNMILVTGPAGEGAFPGEGLPVVPVLKAAVDSPSPSGTSSELVFTRHRVARGETLSRISYKYSLSPNTLISINGLEKPDDVKKGVLLIVPYMDGLRVEPLPGEDLNQLAARFETEPELVQLIPGTTDYFVSGGRTENASISSEIRDVFLYPVTGRILTAFGEGIDSLTGISYHSEGIDLSVEPGTPVNASQDGTVILTGHHASYGLYIIMSHSGGWKSFYGHLSRIDVAPGDTVERGVKLGRSGSSGTARSPRLHFALIHDSKSVDPLDFLY